MKNEKITRNIKTGTSVKKNNVGKNIEKTVNKIVTRASRALNYGDELAYEDREPGIVLDESRN